MPPQAEFLNESDEATLLSLSEKPFASVRQLARRTHLHPSTVCDHLAHKLGFTVRYIRWVPPLLSEADKHTRAQFSFKLFEMLQHQKGRARHDNVTLDEPWFYFTTNLERIWLPEGTEAPERDRITVQPRKIIVIVVWNHTGVYRIVGLPKGTKFHAGHDISHILDSLAEWRRNQVGGSDRRLHVQTDSACPYTAKKVTEFFAGNGMKRPSHPPHSSDPAPCDFYFLGTSNAGLQVQHSRSPINFCRRLMRFFSPLKKSY
jgi:hypothetical protein